MRAAAIRSNPPSLSLSTASAPGLAVAVAMRGTAGWYADLQCRLLLAGDTCTVGGRWGHSLLPRNEREYQVRLGTHLGFADNIVSVAGSLQAAQPPQRQASHSRHAHRTTLTRGFSAACKSVPRLPKFPSWNAPGPARLGASRWPGGRRRQHGEGAEQHWQLLA